MKRLVLPILLLGVMCAATVDGQVVSQPVFLPQQYFVGDIVEARVVVRSDTIPEIEIPVELPSQPWVEIVDVSVVQRADGVEVRIRFQPFFVGTRRLPPIDLGGVTVDSVSAFVGSVLESEEPAGMRDQLLLPGTRLLIAVLVIAAVGIPVIVVLAGDWGRKSTKRIGRWYRDRIPYRRFIKGARGLTQRLHELDAKRFYAELQFLTREFIDRRFLAGLTAATTGEIEDRLSRVGIPAQHSTRIHTMFEIADLVRFAGRRATFDERAENLEELRAIVHELHRNRPEASNVGS